MRLFHGDCLVEMDKVADGSVDMILCDLPYGTTACKWDTIIPFEPLWKQYKRIIKRNGAIVLTASQPFTSALVMSNPKWFKYDWSWDKKNPSGHLNSPHRPLRRHEDVLIFSDGVTTYNPEMRSGKFRKRGGGYRDGTSECYRPDAFKETWGDQYHPTSIIEITNANRREKIHPTQKPVALMEYLIRTYTNEGETVLDNCFGSGTTGVACVNLNRNFIGIEKDAEYFSVGKARIEQAERDKSELLIA